MKDAPTIERLLSSIQKDMDRWIAGQDVDFDRRYAVELESLGPAVFLAALFSRYEGSTLLSHMHAFSFVWKDLAFDAWREVLRRIANSRQAIYQVVWFTTTFLGIDVIAIVQFDADLPAEAGEFVNFEFPTGGPRAGGAWVRDQLDAAERGLIALMRGLLAQAGAGADWVMPGFTHLQTAQPVTWGHHMMAYVEMFGRDLSRMRDARARMNECPLGAAALAGTSFPIDRDMTAAALGFDRPCANSLDAVSDRDFALEFLSAASICAGVIRRPPCCAACRCPSPRPRPRRQVAGISAGRTARPLRSAFR